MATENKYANLRFADFKRMAADDALSRYEKIGFPDAYRQGHEKNIFADIGAKLGNIRNHGAKVLDIGPGCSELPLLLIAACQAHDAALTCIDCAEMLRHLPDAPCIEKVPALFPDCTAWIDANPGRFDAILCYSVLHYAMVDTPIFRFLDSLLSLLAPGGQILIGDIPNSSMRKRFFSSAAGIRFHQEFTQSDEIPAVAFNRIEADQIDDAVVFALLQRARAQGFDAYLLPQAPDLPMANRREDILIVRP
jgi:hypothetical protein